MTPGEAVLREVGTLVDAWWERRCLSALRQILKAWPLTSGLTDEWGELELGLKNVRAFARRELTPLELEKVEGLTREVNRLVHRR